MLAETYIWDASALFEEFTAYPPGNLTTAYLAFPVLFFTVSGRCSITGLYATTDTPAVAG